MYDALNNKTLKDLEPDFDYLFTDDTEVKCVAESAAEVFKDMEEAKQYESGDNKQHS